ncbi:COX15/CtaA family protein [Cellulomonas shaoxiangyii]|uniref:Cytochrome oxidase assembly protein n=1 Tax=Cellulomonas shaoxiangyii TaxID=2566013 RepID=A0A4P7SJ49_9CELL|nr:COX15/CtaA family protein [Cellulomonas shaoxiangyii]QCB93831.1 cytochrome oxidase assembly protein [Cellulomonas shaoxiangyii]TGY84475.1 cytochrome oxidase assembly protein [Cellulomonas shaoxiangyii]
MSTTSTTSPVAPPSPSLLQRLRPRWTVPAVVANLVAQVVIVVTGGAVRLTGSGLGCSTWPQCEPGQFAPVFHEAMSVHTAVEFGNRTLTGLLVVLSAAVALLAGLDRSRSRSYRAWAWAPFAGVALQAVIGGITVLVHLHPAVVGSHFLISMALVAVSAWLLVRTREGDGAPVAAVDRTTRVLAAVLGAIGAVVLVLGVVVTGAGPHSGDEEVGYRFAVDPYAVARVHALSVWAFVAVLVVLLVRVARAGRASAAPAYPSPDGTVQPARGTAPVHPHAPADALGRVRRAGLALLVVTLAQGGIGYVQLFTGLPIALVNLHMFGAAVLTAALALVLGTLRVRGAPASALPATAPA